MKAIKSLWHGVDTAKVGYLIHWPSTFSRKLAEFQTLREKAQLYSAHGSHMYTALGDDPHERFIVRPMGARMMPFAFEGMGMILFFGNALAPWGTGKSLTPNVRVEFQPFSVACHGLRSVHDFALKIIAHMGGRSEGNLLSEIHVTCDMETDRPHQAADYHTSLEGLWRRVRTRIRNNNQDHEVESADHGMATRGTKLKQINIGKDKKMLRIYDKLLELRTHPDKIFEALNWGSQEHIKYLLNRSADAVCASAVMRVEFQLRRERLIERQISTVEDFLQKQTGLWHHLCEEFVVLINDDDANRTRCSTQEWWKAIQEVWTDAPTCELPKRSKPMPDVAKYIDQTMGLLLAIGARLGGIEDIGLADILSMIQARWEASHPESWREVLKNKYERLQVLWADMLANQTELVKPEDPNAPSP